MAASSTGTASDPDKVPKTLPPEFGPSRFRSRTFTPLPLGEILAKRSFDAAGLVNPLSKRKTGQTLVVDVDRDRLMAADDPAEDWEPRSMLAVLDALHALRWAFILVEFGPEHEVHQLFDIFIQPARQRPSHLENFRAYYESASWQLRTALRAGKTFAEAAAQVKMDTHLYQDIMARDMTPRKPQDTKRKVQNEDKRKDGKGTGKDSNSPPKFQRTDSAGDKANWDRSKSWSNHKWGFGCPEQKWQSGCPAQSNQATAILESTHLQTSAAHHQGQPLPPPAVPGQTWEAIPPPPPGSRKAQFSTLRAWEVHLQR